MSATANSNDDGMSAVGVACAAQRAACELGHIARIHRAERAVKVAQRERCRMTSGFGRRRLHHAFFEARADGVSFTDAGRDLQPNVVSGALPGQGRQGVSGPDRIFAWIDRALELAKLIR